MIRCLKSILNAGAFHFSLDSERQMVLAGRAHAAKNDILQEEQAEIKRTHDNMLALNVKNEKKLRTRRYVV